MIKSLSHVVFGWCLALCVMTVSVHAQQPAPTVNLRFVSFPKAANPAPIELLIGEEKFIEVEIPTNSISQTYQVPVLTTWSLGKSSRDPEGKFVFETYGKAQAIGASDQLILVVRKGRDDADGLELYPMKNSAEGFGGGKYLLFNASGVDIAGNIGTSKFALKPNQLDLVAPKPSRSQGGRDYCFAKFYFRYNDKTDPFFSSTWRFNKEARSLVFFYHDPTTKQLRVHTIRSFVP